MFSYQGMIFAVVTIYYLYSDFILAYGELNYSFTFRR